MRKKIEMSLIKSPANGVVIKRIISDGLKEIVSLKEQILLETTAKIQSIEEKREEKVIQGYYDGYAKGIIDVMALDNFAKLRIRKKQNKHDKRSEEHIVKIFRGS